VAVEPMRFVYHEILLDGKQSVHANVAMVKKPAMFPKIRNHFFHITTFLTPTNKLTQQQALKVKTIMS